MNAKYGYLSVQAMRRMQAGELILKGFDNDEIIEALDVSLSSVKRWRAKLKTTDDLQTLVRKRGTGRATFLSEEQSVNTGRKVQRLPVRKCSARGLDSFSITWGKTFGKRILPPHGEGRL